MIRDDASTRLAEAPSAHRVQHLTIASNKVECRLAVGWFAENDEDRRAHHFGEVVEHSLGLWHHHVRLNVSGCKLGE